MQFSERKCRPLKIESSPLQKIPHCTSVLHHLFTGNIGVGFRVIGFRVIGFRVIGFRV